MTPDSRSQNRGAARPRYTSLEDYLGVFRRRWPLVVVCVVVGVAAGIVTAVTREDSYTASASLSFRDVSQDLSLFGVDSLPQEPASVRAAVNAELVTRTEVTRRVARRFEGELTPTQLAGSVVARVGARTQLVILFAKAAEPQLAARIANAYAQVSARVGAAEVDARLEEVAESLLEELGRLERGQGAARPGVGVRISILEQQLSRVQTLRDIAEPVEIARTAGVPGSPDSPSPLASGIFGGALGLLFGIVAAFVRDVLDRRIRNAGDVHAHLGLPVVGRIPETALGSPGLIKQEGVEPLWDTEFEAFRVLRTNLSYLEDEGTKLRCVLVASAKPAEGKTTVSMALASAAALAGQRVLLVEGDLRRPSFAKRALGIKAEPGISEYLRGTAEPGDVVQVVEVAQPRSPIFEASSASPAKLGCIPAGRVGSDAADLVASGGFARFVRSARDAYDLIVIDSSPMLAVVDPLQLIDEADAVLICARAHQTSRSDLTALRDTLENLPERRAAAVITGVRRSGPDSYEYYYGY